jgi:F-type H+-transporting ATPase subunit gamma
MQMVSAAKLRKAQDGALKSRPFADATRQLVVEMCKGMTQDDHPFFAPLPEKKRLGVILVTGDKGLCGSFNNNIIFRAERDLKKSADVIESVSLITVGKKGRDYFKKRNAEVKKSYLEDRERTNYALAAEIAGEVKKYFLSGEWNEVQLYYSSFKTIIKYELTQETILPIPTSSGTVESPKNYIFEPSQKEILDQLLPKFIEVRILKAILESQTSEYAARMTAMDTASNNCRDVISQLTLMYNKARQATITKELLDIVGGAEALKK